jgi:hypothetical protein
MVVFHIIFYVCPGDWAVLQANVRVFYTTRERYNNSINCQWDQQVEYIYELS